jgi:hypothetical protein
LFSSLRLRRERTTSPNTRNMRTMAVQRILGAAASLLVADGVAAASMAGEIDRLTARASALFASDLSARCDHSRAEIAAAIRRGIRSYGGVHGCVGEVAAAYGEHPETAALRMRWARSVVECTNSSVASNLSAGRKPPRRCVLVRGGAHI